MGRLVRLILKRKQQVAEQRVQHDLFIQQKIPKNPHSVKSCIFICAYIIYVYAFMYYSYNLRFLKKG